MSKKTHIEKQKMSEYLRVEFTDEERKGMSLDLARFVNELEQKKLQKKDVVKSIDAEIAKHESSISMLATKVHDGYEYRNVDCIRTFDYDKGDVSIMRVDTEEIIKERPITEEEKQVNLEL